MAQISIVLSTVLYVVGVVMVVRYAVGKSRKAAES